MLSYFWIIFFCRSACEMCCNARLQQGGKVSIYGRKQKFSWQGQSEGQHKNKKQRWWVWKSKEAFFSFWCWFVLPPQNKPIQKTTQGISWSLLSYWTDGQKLWLLPREQRDTLRRALTVWCLSLCVSERGGGGGGGEICPFSIRLLFPSLADGDSSGERDLVLWNAIEYLQVSMPGTARRDMTR